MPLHQLDTENADCNLTSQVTVLTDTPDTANATLCQGLVCLGDGTKDLDGSGGDFELTIQVGSQVVQPDPQIITFSTAVRAAVWTTVFPVPANTQVLLKVKSPNAADTDVDVTAYLYDAIRLPEIDGITFQSWAEILLAAASGVTDPDGNDVPFKKRDGTTTKFTVTYGDEDGERTASTINN